MEITNTFEKLELLWSNEPNRIETTLRHQVKGDFACGMVQVQPVVCYRTTEFD